MTIYSACVMMTFVEFYPLLAMLLNHVMVHISILCPFLFRLSLYSLLLNQRMFIYLSPFNYTA